MPSSDTSLRTSTWTASPSSASASTPCVLAKAYGIRCVTAADGATDAEKGSGVAMAMLRRLLGHDWLRDRAVSGQRLRVRPGGGQRTRRQRRNFGLRPERPLLRLQVLLLAHDVVVAVGGERRRGCTGAHDRRLKEHHQIRLDALPRIVAKKRAGDGDIADVGHFARVVGEAVLDQPAEHDDL